MRVLILLRTLALLTLVVAATGGPDPATARMPPAKGSQEPIIMEPLDLGLHEEAGVSLLSLEVEVVDEQGLPVTGLTMDDFKIFLDGRRWPLVAVDDFCTCQDALEFAQSGQSPAAGTQSGGDDVSAGAGLSNGPDGTATEGTAEDPAAPQPRRFVLFIDFSQLQLAGREMADDHARYWLDHAMQPGDLAMLAGYSTMAGLKTLTRFTGNRDDLLAGLATAFSADEFMDPFPEAIRRRRFECQQCMEDCILQAKQSGAYIACERGCCYRQAREEFLQGRRSLDAMDLLLTTLEGIPGRKDLILFNQNGLVYPAQLFRALDSLESYDVGDHQTLIKNVAASATASRTAVHTANLPVRGNLATTASEGARDLGTRLADYTGGTTNRAIADLDGVLTRAGRECCRYRLSIGSPDNPPNRAMRVRVMVQGKRLPGDYRIRFYSPEQRWFRHARAALAAPTESLDPPITITLSPSYLRDDTWVVKLQAAFSLSDLELVPTVSQRIGRWRVGALLHTEDGEESWEMLSMARATLEGRGSTRLEAVHERRVGSLKPGAYRLRLFVEDVQRGKFSAREIDLELPEEASLSWAEPWLYGPEISRRIDRRINLGLPFTSSEPPIPTPVGPPAVGQIPVDSAQVAAGTMLEFSSMLCPRPEDLEDPSTTSLVLRDGVPIARLPAPDLRNRGVCVSISDEVDTSDLSPGDYSYRLIIQHESGESLESEAPFHVDPGDLPRPPASG
jgi:VWFA-related protein